MSGMRCSLLTIRSSTIGRFSAAACATRCAGRVAICASVIHVHVHIAARPLRSLPPSGRLKRLQTNRQAGTLPGRDGHAFPLKAVFKALHDFDFHASGRHRHFGAARGVKVVGLERALGADEIIVRSHPGVIGSIGAAIFADDEDSRRRGMPCLVQHRNAELAHRFQVVLLFGDAAGSARRRELSSVQSEVLPPRLEMKAMRFPSGDQRGATLSKSP